MISRDAWLAALGQVDPPDDPDALSVRELARLLDCSERATYVHVARLVESGKIVEVSKRYHGPGHRTVKAYRLVTKPTENGGTV